MTINPCFNGIVGQARHKEYCTTSINSALGGGRTASVLFTAPAGVGKTEMARLYGEGLANATGAIYKEYMDAREFRSRGEEFNSLIELITSGERYVLFIDEFHYINDSPTQQSKIIKTFVMKALDSKNENRPIVISDEISAVFNPCIHTIILATNFPEKLDPSGALQSRCNIVQLDLYNEDQLFKIASMMLEKKGLVPEKETTQENDKGESKVTQDAVLKLIAKTGRGTARPIQMLVNHLDMMHLDKNVEITFNAAMAALRQKKIFPQGLTEDEIALLVSCLNRPLKHKQIMAMRPTFSTKQLQASLGFLTVKGWAAQTTMGVETTKKGKQFLTRLRNLNFEFPVGFDLASDD